MCFAAGGGDDFDVDADESAGAGDDTHADESAGATDDTTPSPEAAEEQLKKARQEIKKLREKIRRLEAKKNKNKQESLKQKKAKTLKYLAELLPHSTYVFFSSQIRELGKKEKGRRWSYEEKSIAMTLFHISAKSYRLLKKILILPSVSLLRKTIQQIKLFPGFHDKVIDCLADKVAHLNENAKLCSVVLDEMILKEEVVYCQERDDVEGLEDMGQAGGKTHYAANHVLVVMARGLVGKWKQPIGYFLTSGPMKGERLLKVMNTCFDKLEAAGFIIKSVVSDQGGPNRKLFYDQFKISTENPFIFRNGNKIFFFFDPPHLLKSVRNNLKSSGFLVDGDSVSWSFIEELFHFDKKNPVRLCPKLSKLHFELNFMTKQRVNLAAQILSHSVYSALSFLVYINVLPKEATPTADFVKNCDSLFNIFNSGTSKNSKKENGLPFTGHEKQKEKLSFLLAWLDKTVINSPNNIFCLDGWRLDIASLLGLFEDLKHNHGVKSLHTDRLNQDCLENFFSSIRGKGGHRIHPTAREFRMAFRQISVDSFFSHSPGSNCLEDTDSYLLRLTPEQFAELGGGDEEEEEALQDEALQDLIAIATPAPLQKDEHLKIAEENVLTYIAGYVAYKLKDAQNLCTGCTASLVGPELSTNDEIFLKCKQYESVVPGKGLCVPSRQLRETVNVLEMTYMKHTTVLVRKKVKTHLKGVLMKELKGRPNAVACPDGVCDQQGNIVDSFLTIRIHFTLKDSSRLFKQKHSKRNNKLMKLNFYE